MICKNKKCRSEIPDNSAYCLYCGTSQASKQQNTKSRGNGTGSVYKLPNGKYKAIVTLYYYIKDGRLRRKTASKTFSRRVDAINALPGLKTQSERRDVTLQGLCDLFVTTPKYLKLSKSQKDKLGYAWARLAPLHRKKISEITVDDIERLGGKRELCVYKHGFDGIEAIRAFANRVAVDRFDERFGVNNLYGELPDLAPTLRKVTEDARTAVQQPRDPQAIAAAALSAAEGGAKGAVELVGNKR